MVQFVTRDDVRRGAHAHGVSVGHTLPGPGLVAETSEHQQVAPPDRLELVQQAGPRPPVELRRGNVVVLLEARQIRAVAARKAQRPVGENALGIDQVPQHLPHAPLPGRIPLERAFFRNLAEFRQRAADLGGERPQNIAGRHQVYVAAVIRSVFRSVRFGDKKVRHT